MNEKMRQARETALKKLNPSKADLDRGLALHAESLVVDTYAFAPFSSVDHDVLDRMHESGASFEELRLLTEDVARTRCTWDDAMREEYLLAWKTSGVTCLFQNAGEEGNAIEKLIIRLAHFTYQTDRLREHVQRVIEPQDMLACKQAGRHGLCLTGNGVPLPQRWISVEEELLYIRIFFELGIRMMHITYNRRTPIGDGCGEISDGGLSDFGHAVVKEMNRVGVIVDVAHSGLQTSFDAARASTLPMVASHAGCAGLYDHPRNKSDQVLKAVAETGGYTGMVTVPEFLGGEGDLPRMLDHLDYAVKLVGEDHVAIGTDGSHQAKGKGAGGKHKALAARRRARWGWLTPRSPEDKTYAPEAQESMYWTNWPLFTVGLVQRGYSDEAIRKIIGGNALRVAEAVWQGREEG